MKIVFSCNSDYNRKFVFQKIHLITRLCENGLFKKIKKIRVLKEKKFYSLVYKVDVLSEFDLNLTPWLRIIAMNLNKEKYYKKKNMKTVLHVDRHISCCFVELDAQRVRKKKKRKLK